MDYIRYNLLYYFLFFIFTSTNCDAQVREEKGKKIAFFLFDEFCETRIKHNDIDFENILLFLNEHKLNEVAKSKSFEFIDAIKLIGANAGTYKDCSQQYSQLTGAELALNGKSVDCGIYLHICNNNNNNRFESIVEISMIHQKKSGIPNTKIWEGRVDLTDEMQISRLDSIIVNEFLGSIKKKKIVYICNKDIVENGDNFCNTYYMKIISDFDIINSFYINTCAHDFGNARIKIDYIDNKSMCIMVNQKQMKDGNGNLATQLEKEKEKEKNFINKFKQFKLNLLNVK